MFHFPGFASRRRYSADYQFKTERVSPFGNLRIKGYKPPPRSLSQVSRVLHSRPRPRHPPCTLSISRAEIYITPHYIFFTMTLLRHHCRKRFNYLFPVRDTRYSEPGLSKSFSLTGYAYSYVKVPCLLKRKNRLKRFFRVLQRAGLTAYPLLKNWCSFGS